MTEEKDSVVEDLTEETLEPEVIYETLLDAIEVEKDEMKARLKTRKHYMNCRSPQGLCKGRQVYFLDKDKGEGATYRCTTCQYQWRIATGGAVNF